MEPTNPNSVVNPPTSGVERSNVMKKFPKHSSKQNLSLILISFVVVLAGVGTGWVLSGKPSGAGVPSLPTNQEETGINSEISDADIEGLDEAEGTLVEGGIEGEGTHHLERAGGPSQNVYLTSTVIDLQTHIGKKVHVWGETLSAVQASWLMDVIRIKEIN
jgi:hypothetical protein